MNNTDQKLKSFLEKHDSASNFKAHPNEWELLNHKIKYRTSWWNKKLALIAMPAALALTLTLVFNSQEPLSQPELTDQQAVTYLLDSYGVIDNEFDTPVDEYYTLLD
ncbi:MAG: hypothetical protein AB8E15_11060 [Bdellovibrionales bacterium]